MSLFSYTTKTERGIETNAGKLITHIIVGIVVGIFLLTLLFGSFRVIDEGERGIVLRLGKVARIMEPGFNAKTPWMEKVIKMTVRTQKIETEASAASNDLQVVTSNIALQYNLIAEELKELYAELGTAYKSKIIDPAIQDAVKEITAKFTAEELITKREIVSDEMETILRERLLEAHIRVTNVDIVNFDFSSSFNAAIEQKVTAEQNALREENKLKQVEFEAQQSIEIAKAEATKTRLEAEALLLNANLIEKIRAEAQLVAAQNWNGVLPTHMYGSAPIPLINISQ